MSSFNHSATRATFWLAIVSIVDQSVGIALGSYDAATWASRDASPPPPEFIWGMTTILIFLPLLLFVTLNVVMCWMLKKRPAVAAIGFLILCFIKCTYLAGMIVLDKPKWLFYFAIPELVLGAAAVCMLLPLLYPPPGFEVLISTRDKNALNPPAE